MNRILACVVLSLILENSWAEIYRYDGLNFDTINGPNYTGDMRITGFIEFAEALEPGDTITTDSVLAFEFNDGVQTLNHNNAEIFFIMFSVNELGLPFLYRILVVEIPITNIVGEVYSGITINFTFNTEGFERSEYGFTGPCVVTGTIVCLFPDPNQDSGIYSSPGLGGAAPANWVLLGANPQQVPTSGFWALMFLASLLLIIGLKFHHHKP